MEKDDLKLNSLEAILGGFEGLELPALGEVGDIVSESDLGGLETPLNVKFWDSVKLSPEMERWYEVQALRREKYRAQPKRRKRPGPRKAKYWLREKRKREAQRRNYENNIKWARLGMSLYDRVVLSCKAHGVELLLTEQELREMVPNLENLVGLRCERVDKKGPYSRFNLVIRDKKGAILWDGLEEAMREAGYVL